MNKFLSGMNIIPQQRTRLKELCEKRGYSTLRAYLFFLKKNQKFSDNQIARSLGVGATTIQKWLYKSGIETPQGKKWR